MATMLDDKPENTIVFGNSSLNIMYDTVMRCWVFGTLGSTLGANLIPLSLFALSQVMIATLE